MTAAEASEAVKRISLGPCAIRGLRLTTQSTYDGLMFRLSYVAQDRDTGHDTTVNHGMVVGGNELERMTIGQGADYLLTRARAFVRGAFLHEFEECFRLDGAIENDPHANEKRA